MHESPYRVTFANETWASFVKGFLLNLEVTEKGASEGWRIQRWRKRGGF